MRSGSGVNSAMQDPEGLRRAQGSMHSAAAALIHSDSLKQPPSSTHHPAGLSL